MNFWLNIKNIIISWLLKFSWTNFIEISLIAIILFVFYQKFIRNSQSEKFVKGVFILVFLWLFGQILSMFGLNILGLFLKGTVTFVALSLIVIFQPELRRFLGFLGQVGFISKLFNSSGDSNSKQKNIDVIKEIMESVKYFSKSPDCFSLYSL